MSYQKLTAASKNATGQLVSQPCVVKALGLLGGADAATVKFYDGNSSAGQPLMWGLGADTAGGSDSVYFEGGLRFKTGVYIVITGTNPDVFVAIEQPQSSHK